MDAVTAAHPARTLLYLLLAVASLSPIGERVGWQVALAAAHYSGAADALGGLVGGRGAGG